MTRQAPRCAPWVLAFGLAVAIPAVLAYNAFTRANRMVLGQLDGFAHDLHATLTTGSRLAAQA